MLFSKKLKRATSLLTIALLLVAMVVTAPTASACSALELTSAEGDVYWFRTCDMDNSYNVFGENGSYIAASYLVSYPKGEAIPFVTGDVVAEHTVIGMSFSDSYALLDGINDAGLTGGLLFLDEGTETLPEDVPEGNDVMSAMEGVTYILAQCATIDDVIALCERTNIQALDVPGIPGSDLTATLHFNFVDPNGRGIVIEAADTEHAGF
ncbi:MAG: linear amide C-N hydrolase, partial [Oscillospiraceae bacterium]|nr:linear amide C-N hydrolase [Oscillospiraceae bacterium]